MKPVLRVSAVALFLALLAACSSEREGTPPEDLPTARGSSVASETSGASAVAAGRRLSIDLPAALELAGARNPELRLARLAVEQAENVTLRREFALLPTLYPIFRAFNHDGQAQTQSGRDVNVTRTNFQLQALPAFQWDAGPVVWNVLAASRREDAARSQSEAQRLETVLAAASGYFDLVRSYGEVAIARSAVDDASELLRFERTREGAGAATPVNVLRARSELARRRQDFAEAIGHVARASARLVSVLYLAPDVELVPREEFPDLVTLFPVEADPVELARRALATRPEIAAADAELGAREDERDGALYGHFVPFVAAPVPAYAAYPPLFPTLIRGPYDVPSTPRSSNLPAFGQWGPGGPWAYGQFYGPDSPFGDTGRAGLFGPTLGSLHPSQDFMVYAGVRFGRGGVGDVPEVRRRGLAIQEQHVAIDRVRREVQREVAVVHASLVAAHERLDAARAAVAAAGEALRLERDRLARGAAIQLDVLDAQDVFVTARSEELAAVADYDVAQYRLLRAIGASSP